MATYKLFFATNRNHEGADRWRPKRYGTKFSADGMENLRFGTVSVSAPAAEVRKRLAADVGRLGTGDGEALSGYLARQAKSATIRAYQEKLDSNIAERAQENAKLGSLAMFADLQELMMEAYDVLIYIHGFNVSWEDAVGGALALELMLRAIPGRDPERGVRVVLFTWPSDGVALPWVSYKSDRTEAAGSGAAFGRGMLKLRDYLAALHDRSSDPAAEPACNRDISVLCHSMGNYLLVHALERLAEFTAGRALPRLFDRTYLCAPDVEDTALEPGHVLGRLHETCRGVSVYFNRGDVAMVVSDYTKGQPERLGGGGAAHPAALHHKVEQVDCTPVVSGLVEHSYYLAGTVTGDIRASLDGRGADDPARDREPAGRYANAWKMRAV